ncbi:MAG: Rpn family recombination-promoting nuclease/putative transposase [Spirochaetaceae bacterium]|jgi:predicted transposase/invertase (TIGR01784 family)|nr:Rpn family recombination-promoting nuclease/putative transposase [Spirochaetaceae bacterium]
MIKERLNPLNDFAFQKALGEKGDEEQLLAFLNAVLRRTGKDCLESVEILEGKDLPAEMIRGKASKLDVVARLADKTKVNIEVQLENLYNMEKRSLDYWAGQYIKGIEKGQDYVELPPVIAINILGFEYIPLDDFHTSFHIYEDRHKDYQLTDALELHFLDMIKFRRSKDKDIVNEPLHRWLVYFDDKSPQNLVEEVIKMDPAIQKVQTTMETIQRDEALYRTYLSYEKAERDELNRINGAKRETDQRRTKEIAKKALAEGASEEFVSKITGLDMDTVKRLKPDIKG